MIEHTAHIPPSRLKRLVEELTNRLIARTVLIDAVHAGMQVEKFSRRVLTG